MKNLKFTYDKLESVKFGFSISTSLVKFYENCLVS